MPKKVPLINGDWIVSGEIFSREDRKKEPDLNQIRSLNYEKKIEQKGKFVITKDEISTRMGVLKYYDQSWKLILADDNDNGTIILVPKCPHRYDIWVGTYFESGFNSGNKRQGQVVAHLEMRRKK